MSKKQFDKFINKVESGAKKKERIRQEKKQVRAEKNAYFDEQKRLARERRNAGNGRSGTASNSSEDKPARGFKKQSTYTKPETRFTKTGTNKSQDNFAGGRRNAGGGRSSTASNSREDKPATGFKKQSAHTKPETRFTKTGTNKSQNNFSGDRRNAGGGRNGASSTIREDKSSASFKKTSTYNKPETRFSKAGSSKPQTGFTGEKSKRFTETKANDSKGIAIQKSGAAPATKSKGADQKSQDANGDMPLNKFIAWSGVCGRREAADIVKAGKVTVNGKLVTDPPFRVTQADLIKVNGKKISIQKNLVYILLNKPKDYITTTDDPEGRKTVMDLIRNATNERVFPVGRLDRNTTGVLLLTNDGEVAQRLTHPKYEVRKIYEVRLDKPVTKQQLDTIASGINLEDGFIQPDSVAYADVKDKSVIGIEIHSGKNRIVRRIFEHLGFDVKNLDRVMYGIFTKKNVDRGKWRMLSEKEIRLLKHLNTSFSNKKSLNK